MLESLVPGMVHLFLMPTESKMGLYWSENKTEESEAVNLRTIAHILRARIDSTHLKETGRLRNRMIFRKGDGVP